MGKVVPAGGRHGVRDKLGDVPEFIDELNALRREIPGSEPSPTPAPVAEIIALLGAGVNRVVVNRRHDARQHSRLNVRHAPAASGFHALRLQYRLRIET